MLVILERCLEWGGCLQKISGEDLACIPLWVLLSVALPRSYTMQKKRKKESCQFCCSLILFFKQHCCLVHVYCLKAASHGQDACDSNVDKTSLNRLYSRSIGSTLDYCGPGYTHSSNSSPLQLILNLVSRSWRRQAADSCQDIVIILNFAITYYIYSLDRFFFFSSKHHVKQDTTVSTAT